MNAQDLLKIFLENLPIIVDILIALGLVKLAGKIASRLIGNERERVLKTPTKTDDALELPVLEAAQKLADDLAAGRIDPRRFGDLWREMAARVGKK